MAEDMEWRARYNRGLVRNTTAHHTREDEVSPADALGDPRDGRSLPSGKAERPKAINTQGTAGLPGNAPSTDTTVV